MSALQFTGVLCCFLFTVSVKSVSAQSPADSALYNQSISKLLTRFDQGIGESARLYNGYGYKFYDTYINGNAYMNDANNWENGTVAYDGQVFANVPMMYDLFADQLIVLLNDHDSPYRLVKDKVTSFDLRLRHFVRIPDNDGGIKSGFYEQLYGGRSEVLNKWEKVIKTTRGSEVSKSFVPVYDFQEYYIKKGDKYYSVNSLGSVLDVFQDKKKELKQYIKANDIQFNQLKELSLVSIATYYDHLTN